MAAGPRRTATPTINDGKWRHSAALSEIRAVFLNGEQRSVNRKVQGSNPWSGAKFVYDFRQFYTGAKPEYDLRRGNLVVAQGVMPLYSYAR